MSKLSHVFCTNCGIQNRIKSKFCFKCGNDLQNHVITDNEEETKLINGMIEPERAEQHVTKDNDVSIHLKTADDDGADTYSKNSDVTADASSNEPDQEIQSNLIDQDSKKAETPDIDAHFHMRFSAPTFVPEDTDKEAKSASDHDSSVSSAFTENTENAIKIHPSMSTESTLYMVCTDNIIHSAWDHIINGTESDTIPLVCCHDVVLDIIWDETHMSITDSEEKSQNAEDAKQDLCRFYGSAKGCSGKHCIYSHEHPNSVALCKFFKVQWGGGCQWGDKCKFRHQLYQDSFDDQKADLLHTILKDIVQR